MAVWVSSSRVKARGNPAATAKSRINHKRTGSTPWRSLLATPWFAAGAGIVIAAVLAVDSPAALTYGPTFPSEGCPVHGCGSTPGDSPGLPSTATPGVALKAPGLEMNGGVAAGAGRHRPSARDALVGFRVVRRWPSGFLAVLTVPLTARPGAWRLRFAFPAAHVDSVWGAMWQPSGDGDGGIARAFHWWPGSSSQNDGQDPGSGQVTVSATGAATSPSGCVLDGARCHFG